MKKITRFCDIPQFTSAGNYQADYPIHRLVNYIEDEIVEMHLILNPEFQRGHIWSESQQIAWIEYHLRGGKSGNTIYLNNPSLHTVWNMPGEYNEYVCVDGLQRITAAQRFIHNEIKIFGSWFDEFEDKRWLINHVIHVNINNLKSEKEVLQWYIDMNAGGTPHTFKEIQRVEKMIEKLKL